MLSAISFTNSRLFTAKNEKILRKLIIGVALSVQLLVCTTALAQTFYGPTPYLQASDSPFDGLPFDVFYLEDLEDGLFNTPGVTHDAWWVLGPSEITDSVDADDGTIDGFGLGGYSLWDVGGTNFVFHESDLGWLPTHVGIVWTDGQGEIRFQAFDADGVSLGVIGPWSEPGVSPDSSTLGTTDEDRFFGVSYAGGISRIYISNSGVPGSGYGIEVDHIQYGIAGVSAGPSIEKTLLEGPEDVGICSYEPTGYIFQITYTGPDALVLDTIPAEFEVIDVIASIGDVGFNSANEKANDKSATKITWEVSEVVGGTLTVTIATRQSLGKGHLKTDPYSSVYKPTSCGILALNDGAIAYEPEAYDLGEMVIIAGPTDPLEVEAVCGTKPCTPEILDVEATSTDTLQIIWGDIGCDGAVVYNIYRDGELIAAGESGTAYDDTGLMPATEYCYMVEAVYTSGMNEGNESDRSEPECETTLSP